MNYAAARRAVSGRLALSSERRDRDGSNAVRRCDVIVSERRGADQSPLQRRAMIRIGGCDHLGAELMEERRLSPTRARFNRVLTSALDRIQVGLARHWLALLNGALGLALGLALAAPRPG